MASGKLGKAELPAGQSTVVYTVPSNTLAVVSINAVNTESVSDSFVRISISDNASPSPGDFIEYDTKLNASGVIERTGIIMSAGENLIAKSDIDGLNIRVHGIEEEV